MTEKTNAARILDSAGIAYHIHTFPVAEAHVDAVSAARLMGIESERVWKTLVCNDTAGSHFVFVVPGPSELDLRKAAAAASAKRVRLVPVAEIYELTGYVRGGCSPIGMKRRYPTFLDESAVVFTSILVSAGERGVQIEAAPEDLLALLEARLADLV